MQARSHVAAVIVFGLLGVAALAQPVAALAAPDRAVPAQSTPLVGPPTDKEQCKKDGWRQFNNPVFKNQGDCVSFVNKLGGGTGGGGDPVSFASTPELGSLALFGSGAAGLGVYALMRIRTRRGRGR
jgi:hypothetical protein